MKIYKKQYEQKSKHAVIAINRIATIAPTYNNAILLFDLLRRLNVLEINSAVHDISFAFDISRNGNANALTFSPSHST